MDIGFEIVGAVPKKVRANPETTPTQERMAPVQNRRNPSSDQLKARRQQARQSTKESSTMAATEADLIAKMAAATTLGEQRGYAAELAAIREAKTATLRTEASLDLATEAVQSRFPTLSTATFTQHTAASDWMGEIEPDSYDSRSVEATMRAEATVWYKARPDFVRSNSPELGAQALGMARRLASQFGTSAPGATSAFLETVEHLSRREASLATEAFDVVQKPPYDVPSGSSLPVGVTNKDTFDDSLSTPPDPKSDTNTGNAPSLTEGDSPEGDGSASIENPESGKTHDSGGKDTSSTDYIDGTKTPNTKSNDEKFSVRTTAGGDFICAYCDFTGTPAEQEAHLVKAGPKHQEQGSVTDQLNTKIKSEKTSSATISALVDDVMAWEQGEMSEEDEVVFFQGLIDSGMAWQLQGTYGRTAQGLIDAGLCHQGGSTASRKTAEDTDMGWHDDDCPSCGAGVVANTCSHCGADTSAQLAMKSQISGTENVDYAHPEWHRGSRRTAEGDGSFVSGPTSQVPSLAEGDSTEGDHAQSATQDGVANADHSGGDSDAIDSIDGTVYPKQSSQRTAWSKRDDDEDIEEGPEGGDTPDSDDSTAHERWGEEDMRDKDTRDHDNYDPYEASLRTAGEVPEVLKAHQFTKGDDKDSKDEDQSDTSKWRPESAEKALEHKNKNSSRRTAGEEGGSSCSVCGDSIEKDPSGETNAGYHHNDGSKHDHEAKPGSEAKESILSGINPAFAARVQASLKTAVPTYINDLDHSEQYQEGYREGEDAEEAAPPYADGFEDGADGKPQSRFNDFH